MAEDKIAAIFAAAQELFAARGFEKATMDDIALKAKVAKGTIFYHYKSKEDLFNHMIRHGIERLMAAIREELAPAGDPVERLRQVVRIQTTAIFNNTGFFRVLLSEVWGSQERQQALRQALLVYFRLIEEIVAEGVAAGVMRPIDPTTLADVVFGMTSTAAVHLILSRTEKPLERVISELQGVLMAGIGVN